MRTSCASTLILTKSCHSSLPFADADRRRRRKRLLELEKIADVLALDHGHSRGDFRFRKRHIFEVTLRSGDTAGALVEFFAAKQVVDREVLCSEDAVHPLNAEGPLAIQEVGDVGLLEPGLLGEAKSRELSSVNPLPRQAAQLPLKTTCIHDRRYGMGIYTESFGFTERINLSPPSRLSFGVGSGAV